ncbi:MAG TPA: TetR/AcrR family transcriptional regulator [Marinobacter sp.]|uniref:TetR/AcrR family transcriptional regulator n=1 Tax=Marinobacter sp. TaxID=50741 RepID=UPI002D7EB15E|nr:TetR/AcrR family transcriptional regulator [Marinobacter sp.]HET8799867.1 TetR/AcrR family transcriptional regulator [Marinobacter sp.]
MARPPSFNRDMALANAVSLFWAKGYHGSSMKQIEETLDMRPGSIYAAFGSKDGLYSEALARYAEAGGHELARHMAGHATIIDGLKDYLRAIARGCADQDATPSRACLIVKTLLEASHTHPGLSTQAQAILEQIENTLRSLLEEARQRGELQASTDCGRLARLLQGQIMGLRSIAERNLPPQALTELGDDMASILDAYRTRS